MVEKAIGRIEPNIPMEIIQNSTFSPNRAENEVIFEAIKTRSAVIPPKNNDK